MLSTIWEFLVLAATVVGFLFICCIVLFFIVLFVHIWLERMEKNDQMYDEPKHDEESGDPAPVIPIRKDDPRFFHKIQEYHDEL